MKSVAQKVTNSGPCGLWRKNQNGSNLRRLDTDNPKGSEMVTSYHGRRRIHIADIAHAGWHGEHVYVVFRS
jgi:hypothetical protein